MRHDDFSKCLVAILGSDGAPEGCGFVCGPVEILTCTHVVRDALQGKLPEAGDAVSVYFPEAIAAEEELTRTCKVVEANRPMNDGDTGTEDELLREDICLLRLAEGVKLPPRIIAAVSSHHEVAIDSLVRGVGLRRFKEAGPVKWTAFKGITAIPIRSRYPVNSLSNDQAIRKGNSGAPLFSGTDGLIGMARAAQGNETGDFIPIAALRKVTPIAPAASMSSPVIEARSRSGVKVSRAVWRRAFETFDRIPQATDFTLFYQDVWLKRRSGFLCAIGGVKEDLPIHCRDRFVLEYARQKFPAAGDKAQPDPMHINWPTTKVRRPSWELRKMQNILLNKLAAASPSPADIRLAIEQNNQPAILYSCISQAKFGPNELSLLQEWASYFNEISPAAGEHPLIHLLLLEFDLAPQYSEDGTKDWIEDVCKKVEPDPGKQILYPVDPLHSVSVDLVRDWIAEIGADLNWTRDEVDEICFKAEDDLGGVEPLRVKHVKAWADHLSD